MDLLAFISMLILSRGFTFSVVRPCYQVGLKQQAGIIEDIHAVPPSTYCAACVITFHNVPDLDWGHTQ